MAQPKRLISEPSQTADASAAGFLPIAALVAIVALLARYSTRLLLGILPTRDSFDYLQEGHRIAAGDWSSARLGTYRLPGYPALLALLERVSVLDADGLLLVQQALGVASAIAFAWCAWRLGGRVVALAVGLSVAIHPAFLLFEHQPMSETLFIASLALVLVTAERVRAGRHGALDGLSLGLAASAAMLIRANGAVLVLFLLAGTHLAGATSGASSSGSRAAHGSWRRLATGTLVGLLALLGPWLLRQELRIGRPSLTDVDATRLIYLAQHRLIDTTLPRFAPYRSLFDPDEPATIYAVADELQSRSNRGARRRWLVATLFASSFETGDAREWSEATPLDPRDRASEAESPGSRHEPPLQVLLHRPALTILSEQLRAQPQAVRRARIQSFLAFLGASAHRGRTPWGQDDLRFWLRDQLGEPRGATTALLEEQRGELAELLTGADAPPIREGSPGWARAGLVYLSRGRPTLVLALLLSLALPILERRRARSSGPILLFSIAFLATAALHGWMLAGYERFAVPFDPLLVLALALALRRQLG